VGRSLLVETLRSGTAGKAEVGLSARGEVESVNTFPLPLPVTAQLLITDGRTSTCWQTVFSEASVNDPGEFRAKGPSR
jgi:hypothetical protein